MTTLKYIKLNYRATEPTYGSAEAACFDLYAAEAKLIGPSEIATVSTGISFQVPEGFMLEVRPRSGLSRKGIVMANSPGTIDSDYTGELFIILHNTTSEGYNVDVGDRIAQGLLVAVNQVQFEDVEGPKNIRYTERGDDGLGSTGR